jgi:phospholipid/cholesterol/gamma-HCH transport system substrate-binding protein
MSINRKNFFVGVTVLVGMIALAWMVIKFGDEPAKMFTKARFPIHFIAERADGVSSGSQITFRGVNVGRVTTVKRASDGFMVEIDGEIDLDPPLPNNLVGMIRNTSMLGGSAIVSLEPVLDQPSTKSLEKGDTLKAMWRGQEFIPREFADLARDMREQQLVQHVDEAVVTVREQAVKIGQLTDSLNKVVSDEKMIEDLRVALANVRSATAKFDTFGSNLQKLSDESSATITQARSTISKADEKIETLAKEMNARLIQTAKLLDTFNSIAAKIDRGDGTAGLLVNDPRLYESLVDSAKLLNATMADLQRLAQQWEQEGARIKLR